MFVTTNVLRKQPIFADPAVARIAVEVLYAKQEIYPFYLFGFVVMPDHCHFLLQIPNGGSISKLMYSYKRGVAFSVGRGPVWQSRFFVEVPQDSLKTLRYIHQNPVEAGLCKSPEEYLWSSASGKWDVMELEWNGCF